MRRKIAKEIKERESVSANKIIVDLAEFAYEISIPKYDFARQDKLISLLKRVNDHLKKSEP